ncbi:MAG: Methylenetetrahydrofolate dehydrogenase [Paenibacillus sp.]|jgi:methylenetetrahydrofolate dehydrogenase (NADP+)/methenyltetrahydrofolate cyclohydrolase|nr:Methylenetetrahydrofolate dehydrogenase [Paenibacillus sp.]
MSVQLRGKAAADEVYERLSKKITQLQQQGESLNLAVVAVTGDPASAYYVQAKRRIASRLGIGFQLHEFSAECQEEELINCIRGLNEDRSIHGIMLELPLPIHVSTKRITNTISPNKDVDGVTETNQLALFTGSPDSLLPATPQACIRLAQFYGYSLEGRNVTLVGRGRTVGMPLFHLLQRENATVTVCHSRTLDLARHLSRADLIFVAIGASGIITREMTHESMVIIDAGMNELEDGTITGDVDSSIGEHIAAFSPTPGGVGPLTTAILFENIWKAFEKQSSANRRLDHVQ